jgi:hypothetical protein
VNVEFGNPNPVGVDHPSVTRAVIPDFYTYAVTDDAAALAAQVRGEVDNSEITHQPGQEALVAAANIWRAHGNGTPSWVWSDNDNFAILLGHYFGCPVVGHPTNEE